MSATFICACTQRAADAQPAADAEAARLAMFREWFLSYRREAALTNTAEQNREGPDWLFPDDVLLEKPSAEALGANVVDGEIRLGLVSMIRQPNCDEPEAVEFYQRSVLRWLAHHTALGFERFFLHVEASPALCELLTNTAPWNERVVVSTTLETPHDYFDIVSRQSSVVAAAIPRAREAGLTLLLHIDDDELLYSSIGPAALRAHLAKTPRTAADLHLSNIEALPYMDGLRTDIFSGVHVFRHGPRHFAAYTNGKSFGRLDAPGLRPKGAHRFAAASASSYEVPPYVACVLHYEASTFALWRAKFNALARRHGAVDEEEGNAGAQVGARPPPKIPFAYYRESIAAAQALLQAARPRRRRAPKSTLDDLDDDDDEDVDALLAEAAASKKADAVRLAVATDEARALWARWKQAPAGLPPPPGGRSAPLVLRERGVTLLQPLGWTCEHGSEMEVL